MKKQLTERSLYNIITKCDEVRRLLSQSPGEGVFISGFGHFRDYFFCTGHQNLFIVAETPRLDKQSLINNRR